DVVHGGGAGRADSNARLRRRERHTLKVVAGERRVQPACRTVPWSRPLVPGRREVGGDRTRGATHLARMPAGVYVAAEGAGAGIGDRTAGESQMAEAVTAALARTGRAQEVLGRAQQRI